MSIRRWTSDEDRKLRALVAERPRLSAREIGVRMGRNRNSVIGRCHRIGLALLIPPNGRGHVRMARRPKPAQPTGKPGGASLALSDAVPGRVAKLPAGLKRGKWSDEEVTRLQQLFDRRPRLSAVEIANKLNRSTGSVRGALSERGLSLRERKDECKPASEPERTKLQQESPISQPERPISQPERPISQPPTRFADLAPHQCRFPIGEDQPGPDMACCGQAVVDHFADGIRATHCVGCLKKMVALA